MEVPARAAVPEMAVRVLGKEEMPRWVVVGLGLELAAEGFGVTAVEVPVAIAGCALKGLDCALLPGRHELAAAVECVAAYGDCVVL